MSSSGSQQTICENDNEFTPNHSNEEDNGDEENEQKDAEKELCLEAEDEDLNDEEEVDAGSSMLLLNRKISSNSSIATIKNYGRNNSSFDDG